MKVSICIPTWEQYGQGSIFLSHLLETICTQSYNNFNIIISDHSLNDDIKSICETFKKRIDIVYLKNERNRGNSPSNTNNTILHADGDIIKIMFQDDFFYDENALTKIVSKFERESCEWIVSGCNHTYNNGKTFDRFMIPKWDDEIIFGKNTISSPSVLSFRNNKSIHFDENLIMMMDCEIYYQFFIKYGLPSIIEDCLITNRVHQKQISNLFQGDINKEIEYIKLKHNLK